MDVDLRCILAMHAEHQSICRVIEEALLIGRAAHEVAHASASLPLALAPLTAWPSASPSTASSALSAPVLARPPRGPAAASAAARLRPVQDALGVVYEAAFERWACWAAAGLVASFVAALATEPALQVAYHVDRCGDSGTEPVFLRSLTLLSAGRSLHALQ